MINKIIASAFFICLLIAIPLATIGITRVDLGAPFLSFMRTTSNDMQSWRFSIPNIPSIPQGNSNGAWWAILAAFVSFANFFISVLNAIINFFNVVIELFQFLCTLLKNLIMFKDTLARSVVAVTP